MSQEDSRIEALRRIREAVGPAGVIDTPDDMAPYLKEGRGRFRGDARMVVRPACTAEVAAVVRACADARLPIVPQGGNTGLVGGSIPFEDDDAIILSLSRMDRIRAIDPLNYTITVEAGCILQRVREAAEAVDRLFPVSLGAEGSCRIGGNLSTNAGGLMTVRHGNMREQVLGLEVVLPDGQVWDGLRALRKDNTGYDLKQLFIGAEGTLGVITAAVLRLAPRPEQVETVFAAVPDAQAALALLARLRAVSGDAVEAFELMPRLGLDFALAHIPGTFDPLTQRYPWYVLTDLSAGRRSDALRVAVEEALAETMTAGLVLDACLAESHEQSRRLWHLREALVEAQRFEGGSIKHDISIPVSSVPAFIHIASETVCRALPGVRALPFGHVGDGNIHFNLSQPAGADTTAFLARWEEINRLVHDIVLDLGGSISAEHGIGRAKRDELARVKSPVEMALMRRIKQAFDPSGIMNPGKLLS